MKMYRPPVKKSAYDGLSGAANVALSKDKTKVKVTFERKADGSGGDEHVVLAKECPKEVQAYLRSGNFVVKLSKESDKIYSLSPTGGMFVGKVAKFSSKKDADPSPMTKVATNQEGQTYSYLFFVVMIEITEGECKGMEIPLFLRYNFAEDEQEIKGAMRKVVGYSKSLEKSKHTAFLDEFLTITGAWDAGAIQYSDNILPKLEQRIKRADKTFGFIVKKGYIDTLYEHSGVPEETKVEEDFNTGADFDPDDLTDDPTEDKFE
jgi:hypothetical protein